MRQQSNNCQNDPNECTIAIRVNVIYDKTVNKGKGLTDEQKKKFENDLLKKAQKDFGKSNIKLETTYTPGTYTVDANGTTNLTGLQQNSINLIVSNYAPGGEAGASTLKDGLYVSFVNVDEAHSSNVFPLWGNTVEHEITHHLLHHTDQKHTLFGNLFSDMSVDSRLLGQT